MTPGTPAHEGEFQLLIRKRLWGRWIRTSSLAVLFSALVLQNLWVHMGIANAAALYPYGSWGIVLLGMLFLVDPLTLAYIYLLGEGIHRALPGWPRDPALLLAGTSPREIYSSLLWTIIWFILLEMAINFTIHLVIDVYHPSGLPTSRTIILSHLLLVTVSVFAVASSIICATLLGRGIFSRYIAASLFLAPLMAVIFTAEILTFDSISSTNDPPSYGYYLSAVPVMIILGQIYALMTKFIIGRKMRQGALQGHGT